MRPTDPDAFHSDAETLSVVANRPSLTSRLAEMSMVFWKVRLRNEIVWFLGHRLTPSHRFTISLQQATPNIAVGLGLTGLVDDGIACCWPDDDQTVRGLSLTR